MVQPRRRLAATQRTGVADSLELDIHSDRPVAVDLYAGAGGLSLGLEQAGFDVLASAEYDPVHAATHSYNFPLTEIVCDDLGKVRTETIAQAAQDGWSNHRPGTTWNGQLDLVVGGPPCQGFSWIGKRRVDDERNDLIFHFYRVVRELRPRYFVMENVPGIASGAHGDLLQDLIRRFRRAGYVVAEPKILNAAEFGVPQNRRRLMLVGWRRGEQDPGYPTPTTSPARAIRGALPLELPLPLGPTVWDALGDLPDLDAFSRLLTSDTVALAPSRMKRMELAASEYARAMRGPGDECDLSYQRDWDPDKLTSSMRTVHSEKSIQRFANTAAGTVEPVSRFLRLDPSGLCNTLRAGTGGERGAYTSPRPIHPVHPRVISVREAARLHSFPDWFRPHVTKWHGFRQIGNAVPPRLGRAIGSVINAALGGSMAKPTHIVPLGDPKLLSLNMSEAASTLGADHTSMPKSRRESRLALAMEG